MKERVGGNQRAPRGWEVGLETTLLSSRPHLCALPPPHDPPGVLTCCWDPSRELLSLSPSDAPPASSCTMGTGPQGKR